MRMHIRKYNLPEVPQKQRGWTRITVVLLNRHIAYLDRLAVDIRLAHGRIIRRDALVRAFVEATMRRGVDLTQADSYAALVALLRRP
jgi:hypothetical protein